MMRYCRQSGCTGLALSGHYCPAHERNNSQTAKNAYRREPWYGRSSWDRVRVCKLHANPMCERCLTEPATQVHHRDDSWRMTRDWRSFIDQQNLESLCAHCHSRETMERNQKRGVL
jgi:hypothetical protein